MLSITTANKHPDEKKVRSLLLELITELNLEKYQFTDSIVIKNGVKPHSHPVLTLSTRFVEEPDLLVSNYLHEQIHWWESSNWDSVYKCIYALREVYPDVPVGEPEGAHSLFTTYLHLITNTLELDLVRKTLGITKADKVFDFWKQDHYIWIYKKVLTDSDRIKELMKEQGLVFDEG